MALKVPFRVMKTMEHDGVEYWDVTCRFFKPY